ncbi:DUF4129 domain-containing transglutaminase family protein [Sporosarcina sp. FSL K6-1522]|uniref:DUF4129 domain-containing transglutaminase family protein n=1 Tax=Sporosarcina sp. FSL K6-1522 TaxID=2921554 RepID=UPI00315A423A
MMNSTRIDRRLLVLLYVLAFFLLWEWLNPVMALTDTNYLSFFLAFIALSLVLAIVEAKWWLAVPLKILYIFWAIHYVYLDKVLFSMETVLPLVSNLLSNVGIIVTGNWEEITNPFRTLLFYALLWMTTYLIRHWIEVRKSILLFYAMTVVFIAFIDTFSSYSAEGSIFRIMASGILLLGLLAISRLAEKHQTPISLGAFIAISVPLLLVVIASGAFASVLPKQEPVWPDPVPFMKAAVQGGKVTGAKSGYGPDDSKLGGSFVPDNTVVFEAKVERKQYWKIETKNTYTSKGWEQVPAEDEETSYMPGMEMGTSERFGRVEANAPLRAELQVTEDFPFIVYPYGMETVQSDEDVLFLHSELSGKYRTEIGGSEGTLAAYEIDFVEPDYSLKTLRETRMADYDALGEDLSAYLQLPEQLPERVRELAESIANDHDSVYEKTKAIERYFGRNGFVYTQQNVAVPKDDQDYVDQFLFDTKSGYCDNFSTSMVVMLRSLDIPARWVKGFAPGKIVKNDDGDLVYQVTNNEAHSWVEVYMPGVGWMPFEPTIGFNNLTDIENDVVADIAETEMPDKEEPVPPKKKPEQAEKPEEANKSGKTSPSISKWLKEHDWLWIVALVGLVLVGWRLFVVRVKWLPRILLYKYQSDAGDWETFIKQYQSLLKQLDRLGLKRAHGMTLSEYALKVDQHFSDDKMQTLTDAYEKGLYGGNTTDHDWVRLQEMWKKLINRTSG